MHTFPICTEIYVYLHIHIYAHPFRDPNVLEHLIKAQEETGYIWICRSEDQSLTWQVTSFSLAVCEHMLSLDASHMWDYITNTHAQSNTSCTNYRRFISKHFWNRTESKTLLLQESSLERQFNRLKGIFPKILPQIILCYLLKGQNNVTRAPSEFPINTQRWEGRTFRL